MDTYTFKYTEEELKELLGCLYLVGQGTVKDFDQLFTASYTEALKEDGEEMLFEIKNLIPPLIPSSSVALAIMSIARTLLNKDGENDND
ncbi:hypothetical protein [Priestia aryabhattai]